MNIFQNENKSENPHCRNIMKNFDELHTKNTYLLHTPPLNSAKFYNIDKSRKTSSRGHIQSETKGFPTISHKQNAE